MNSLSIQNSRCLNYAMPLGGICTAVSGGSFGYLVVTGIPFAGIVPIISYVAATALGGVGLFFLSYAFFARNRGVSFSQTANDTFNHVGNFQIPKPTSLPPSLLIQPEPAQSPTVSNPISSLRSPTTALGASSQIANNSPLSNYNPPITLLSTHQIASPSEDQGAGFAAPSVPSPSSSVSSSSRQNVPRFYSVVRNIDNNAVDEFALGDDHDHKHLPDQDFGTPIEEAEMSMSRADTVSEEVGARTNKGQGSKTRNGRRKYARKQASKKKAAQREAAAKRAADLAQAKAAEKAAQRAAAAKRAADLAQAKAAEKAAQRAAAARSFWRKATDTVSSIASSALNAVASRMPEMPQISNLLT